MSADGHRLATASFDGTARLWDLASGALIQTLPTHGGAVGAVVFSSTGEVVTGGENGGLHSWTLDPPTPHRLLPKPGDPITALALDAAGRTAIGLQSGYVVILDDRGQPAFHQRMHGGSITSIVFADGGRRMLTASGRPVIGGWLGEGTVNSWDFTTNKERTAMFGTMTGRAVAIGISPDGAIGLRSLEGGAIEVWDLAKSEQVRTLQQPETARCLAFSSDGSVAASGADDSTIRLWNAKDWTERRLLDGHLAAVTALLFCNDGHTLVSGSIDHSVAVWNLDEVPETTPIEEHSDGYAVVATAPGTPMVAAGRGDGVVRLWDVANHELVTSFGDKGETKPAAVTALSFSNDAELLAVGSRDGMLSIWKGGSDAPLLQKKGPLITSMAWLPKKTGVVFAFGDRGSLVDEPVAFGAAGGRIAVGARGLGGVVMNDFRGRPGYTVDRHSMGIAAVAITPDGRRVVTASEDGTARVWDLATRPAAAGIDRSHQPRVGRRHQPRWTHGGHQFPRRGHPDLEPRNRRDQAGARRPHRRRRLRGVHG